MPDNKRPTAPASRPKARPQGILARIGDAASSASKTVDKYWREHGMSDETKRALGSQARGPLGVLNRAVLAAADVPLIGLGALGEGLDATARKVDDISRKTGAADKLSWKGNKFLPGTAGMALLEAFPLANPTAAELATVSGAAGQARRLASAGARKTGAVAKGIAKDPLAAATTVGKTVKAIAKDTSGEVGPAPKKTPKKGALSAVHYSKSPKLTETDPNYWGTNKTAGFIPKEERSKIGTAPGRTYFGLKGEGTTRPYSKESGVGPYKYETELDADRIYDMDADPLDLKARGRELPKDPQGRYDYNGQSLDGQSLYEHLIKDEGFGGYRTNNPMLGDVAASFDPVSNLRRVEQPLEGAPTRTRINGELTDFGPYDPLRESARRYTQEAGIEYNPPTRYAPQDPEFGAEVAKAYDEMPHDPFDPDVAEAYQALKDEMLGQYNRLTDDGYKFSFQDPNADPYPNPWQASQDLRDNKQMQVYPTSAGFGSGAKLTPEDVANNPLLETAPGIQWRGAGGVNQPVTYNDIFRANHDAYGHAKEGFGFRADGENAAYLQHLATLSPPAQRALATETLGQNSWLNFGPNGAANRTANVSDTVFADQKAGLLPDELIFGGQAADFMPDPRSTDYGMRKQVLGKDRRDPKPQGILGYHGTDVEQPFDRFNDGPAYFTDKPEWAQGFGSKRVVGAELDIKNPYEIDGVNEGRHFEWDDEDIADFRADGYDGVRIKHPEGDVYTTFDPSQIAIRDQGLNGVPDLKSSAQGQQQHAARVWNDEGLEKVIAQREAQFKQGWRNDAMADPKSIYTPTPVAPDFAYAPSYSKLRNGTKREDLDIKVDELPMAPRKVINPEELQGSTLFAGMADRTRAGGILRQVNDMKFFDPVRLQGGQDFMREQAGNGSMWAGELGPTNAVLRRAAQTEGDAYFAPFTMGGASGDYSTMMSDAMVEGLQRMPKGSRLELDELMRELAPNFAGTFGVTRDAAPLRNQLRQTPALRTEMAKLLDTAKWRDKGAPDIGMLRHAITDPRLADAPNEAFGYSLGKIDKSGSAILDPADPHGTYRAQMPGEYAGGFEVMVPPNIMFPDVFDKAMQGKRGRQDVSYVLKRGVPTQQADQKWLDGIMPYYEQAKSMGTLDW